MINIFIMLAFGLFLALSIVLVRSSTLNFLLKVSCGVMAAFAFYLILNGKLLG